MKAPLILGEWRDLPGAAWPQQRAEVRRDGALVGELARLHCATSVQARRADGAPVFNPSSAPPRSTGEWVTATSFPDVDSALEALARILGHRD